ncbi:MAG: Uma2 family endonuclease [Pseudonocardiaceae bacterium]|nr:Uma2 family endonuclease [Pseudonocardiaceae bacterium]
MTALPEPPGRLLTIAEYSELGEDDRYRWELQEGNLVMSPSPSPRHMLASGELRDQLSSQAPRGVRIIQDVDIDLQLSGPDQPGWSRRPDLVAVEQAAVDRVEADGGLLRAAEVQLVIEIVSPGSRRMDYVIKRGEYADAGIAHYWIVNPDRPVSLLAFHVAGDLGYADDGEVTGVFTTTEPYALTIALGELI